MKLIVYIKTTLKNLCSSWLSNLLMFLFIPIFVGVFTGILVQEEEKSPLDLKPLKIEILDEDNSEESKKLIKFLEDEKEFLEISKEEEENILIIPKGYEEDLRNNKNSLILKVREESIQQKNLETLIYKYMNKERGNTSYIEENIVETDKGKNSSEEALSKTLSFVIGMFVYNIILSKYMKPSVNIHKRTLSMPLSKKKIFIYDFISTLVYAFIIVCSYVMIIRIFNIGFDGDLLSLFCLIFITAFFMASAAHFVMGIFSEKPGKVLGGVFFISLLAEIFEVTNIRKILKLQPAHYLIKAFENYGLYGDVKNNLKEIIIIFIISIVLFIITYIVKVFRKEDNLK